MYVQPIINIVHFTSAAVPTVQSESMGAQPLVAYPHGIYGYPFGVGFFCEFDFRFLLVLSPFDRPISILPALD